MSIRYIYYDARRGAVIDKTDSSIVQNFTAVPHTHAGNVETLADDGRWLEDVNFWRRTAISLAAELDQEIAHSSDLLAQLRKAKGL